MLNFANTSAPPHCCQRRPVLYWRFCSADGQRPGSRARWKNLLTPRGMSLPATGIRKSRLASSDELGELAESFNRMTRELLAQREHLLQAERVAAWRELARRLAHELKNPLFPLQLTVENLLRARQQSPQQFEEIFQESSSTLLAEIANLKAIISRFSEFSRMPQPQFQQIQLNDSGAKC